VVDKCYNVDFIEVRSATGNGLPLAFVSGKHAIDADFSFNGKEWMAKKATYFGPTSAYAKGKTKGVNISLKDFDFEAIRALIVD
jgi:hypothetical protein